MAYLNHEEREKLARDLSSMKFNQAKGRLRRIDAQGRLRYIRNSQAVGEYHTRFELDGLGVVVTLVEHGSEPQSATDKPGSASVRLKPEFVMSEVIVEPTPENRT